MDMFPFYTQCLIQDLNLGGGTNQVRFTRAMYIVSDAAGWWSGGCGHIMSTPSGFQGDAPINQRLEWFQMV